MEFQHRLSFRAVLPLCGLGHSWSVKGSIGDVHTPATVLVLDYGSTSLRGPNLNVCWEHGLVTNNVFNPHDSLQAKGVHLQFALNLW